MQQVHSNYFGGWSVIVDERRDVYRGGRGALGFPPSSHWCFMHTEFFFWNGHRKVYVATFQVN